MEASRGRSPSVWHYVHYAVGCAARNAVRPMELHSKTFRSTGWNKAGSPTLFRHRPARFTGLVSSKTKEQYSNGPATPFPSRPRLTPHGTITVTLQTPYRPTG